MVEIVLPMIAARRVVNAGAMTAEASRSTASSSSFIRPETLPFASGENRRAVDEQNETDVSRAQARPRDADLLELERRVVDRHVRAIDRDARDRQTPAGGRSVSLGGFSSSGSGDGTSSGRFQ
jgi:hypothetical protein